MHQSKAWRRGWTVCWITVFAAALIAAFAVYLPFLAGFTDIHITPWSAAKGDLDGFWDRPVYREAVGERFVYLVEHSGEYHGALVERQGSLWRRVDFDLLGEEDFYIQFMTRAMAAVGG